MELPFFAVCLFISGFLFLQVKCEVRPQIPGVWDALDKLRGKMALQSPDIQELFYMVQPGVDFPIYSGIPETGFQCSSVHQGGYYADLNAQCQVFHRCDQDSVQTSYLCPNMTVFNQITLICDWWYNVDCAQSKQFYDYSNTRLYQGEDVLFLDNQDTIADRGNLAVPYVGVPAGGNVKVANKPRLRQAQVQAGPQIGFTLLGEAQSQSDFQDPYAASREQPAMKKKGKRSRVRNN